MPASPPPLPDGPEADFLIAHSRILLDSYQHWTGTEILQRQGDPEADARALFHAGFGVMSHNTDEDPLITYGNAAALKLFEADWTAFTGTPSRKTATPDRREERARLLEEVLRHGYSKTYAGTRISFRGQQFHIQNVTVWNLLDEEGRHYGQAALIPQWQLLK